MWRGCLFCGGNADAADHARTCDGRQGAVEAEAEALPRLISGLTPDTWAASAEAAESIEPGRGRQRDRVEAAIVGAGLEGRTDDEVQAALGLSGHSECPRRIELWQLGRIVVRRDAEDRPVRRLTRTGRTAVVWIDARLEARAEAS